MVGTGAEAELADGFGGWFWLMKGSSRAHLCVSTCYATLAPTAGLDEAAVSIAECVC